MNKFLYICLAAVIMMVLTIVLVPTQSAVAATTETKLVAGDGAADDNFGLPIDISGDTIVVGAYLDDGTFNNSGAAYVFTRIDDVWTQEAKLTADDGAAEDRFGSFVAIDGDTIVVGAQRDDVNGDRSGSAYVFTRSGTAWTQTAKLIPSDGAAGDRFGTSVAISGDTVIIGAPQDDDNGDGSGSAYVFALVDDIWIQEANLTPSDGAEDDEFGNQLAIEGNTAVIGTAYNSGEKGAAYVFVNSGGTWTQSAKLTADDGAAEDRFGTFMDIDGDTIVVTSFLDDDHADNSGSVYVFTGSGAEWTQEAKLTADDAAENDFFGYPVAIDGDTVMVGAPRDDDNGDNSGSIYVFTRSDTVWTQDDKFVASDTAAGDWFGAWIAIRGDTIAVAAPFDDDNGDNSGSIYMFKQLPAITSISPVQAKQGKTTDVTITGRYLTGTSVVSFGTGISVNSFTVDSATQITANITVTANATLGTKDILVTNPIGSDTLADGFTLQQAPPTIISISPIAAKQGQALSATITGTYFTGASMVSLGTGITTNSFTVDSATQITAYITVATDATLGTRDVSVTTATGSDTLADGFTVQQAPPTVTSISPATAKQGETLSITITGTDFTGASLVSLGTGITTNSFTVDSATQITMNVTVALNATAETKDVLVYTSSGADTLTDGFTIEQETQPTTNSPTITAINPTSGQQGKMLNVTITGIDLTGAIEVSLGTDVTVNLYTVNSATQITANITVATDATAGTRDVSVTTPTGSDTLAASFTVEVATPTEPTASTGCGASAAAASVTDIVSGWGLIGLLGTSSIFIHRKQKKRKSK